jgi:hypothetical protein
MAIKNVAALFKEIDAKEYLRSKLYACTSKDDLIRYLKTNHLDFTMEEFEDAINMMHTECQTQEAANELFSKANWFKFLFYSLKN